MKPPMRILFVLVIAGSCFLGDRLTKDLATEKLAGQPPVELLGGCITLAYQENRGGMLSLGASLPEPVRFWIFTVLIGTLLAGLAAFTVFKSRIETLSLVSASLVLGGGTGNLVDRILHDGAVVDFLTVGMNGVRTGVFNGADLAIIGGVTVYAIQRWLMVREVRSMES